jgi:hypothetical protein
MTQKFYSGFLFLLCMTTQIVCMDLMDLENRWHGVEQRVAVSIVCRETTDFKVSDVSTMARVNCQWYAAIVQTQPLKASLEKLVQEHGYLCKFLPLDKNKYAFHPWGLAVIFLVSTETVKNIHDLVPTSQMPYESFEIIVIRLLDGSFGCLSVNSTQQKIPGVCYPRLSVRWSKIWGDPPEFCPARRTWADDLSTFTIESAQETAVIQRPVFENGLFCMRFQRSIKGVKMRSEELTVNKDLKTTHNIIPH